MLSREERARQFLPFDALNGFYQTLKEKEVEYLPRPELSEDQIEEISQKLRLIDTNTYVKIIYYSNGKYFCENGKVKQIDLKQKKIQMNQVSIRWIDIVQIIF